MGDAILYIAGVVAPLACAAAFFAFARAPFFRSWPSWLRLIAGNLLVFVLLVSTLFIVGETYSRFFSDTTDSFAQTRVSQRWYDRHFRRNNADVRDNEDYVFSRGSRPRITFVGDSFTAAHGVANVDDRFANLVRSRKHGAWEVHVFAEPGHDTGEELAAIENLRRRGYEFDRVVLVYCLNDVSDLFPTRPDLSSRVSSLSPPLRFVVHHSFLVDTFFYRYTAQQDPYVANYYDYLKSGYEGEVWGKQQARLRQFNEIVRAGGGRLSVVLFPFVHALGADYVFRDAHDRLRQVFDEMHVPCLDLLPVLEPHKGERLTVNRWDAHPNERAQVLAADAILPWLESLH